MIIDGYYGDGCEDDILACRGVEFSTLLVRFNAHPRPLNVLFSDAKDDDLCSPDKKDPYNLQMMTMSL